ncbi:predicted protein [Naegleria gruberi]|uniref:Predicted protein n=1 Tax=Naegleria gruberi TaxID=5762 RepID=D2V041_NAEGR|nr:uncharacterized protein NAEGRDRAFT_62161 [Naegleria gruberi]EFC49464.1 predicted protein [Naegleria gruberi]|eukprot:XP_002682208.1 predicted protein [Naegleria gruberi strain NEG-M]
MGNHHTSGSSMFASVNDRQDVMNPRQRKLQEQQYETDQVSNDDDEMNQELTRMVKEQEQVDENEIKNGLPFGVILLGSADSGKSTLWNRWKLQTQPLSQSEKVEFANSILTYIITCLKRLLDLAKSTLSKEDYQNLYSKHDFSIDLLSQISECGSTFEYLFTNPISKTKMQSLWIDHDFIAHLPALFMEPCIQELYLNQFKGKSDSNNDHSNHPYFHSNQIDGEEGIVNEILLGNYLHYFLQTPSFLQELSETFTHSAANSILRDYSTSPSSELFSKPIQLTLNDILKSKIVTTSINTLKFQFSKKSISTKVIKVIEKRKRGLSGAALPNSGVVASPSGNCPNNESIQVHGKCGNVAIPKLVLNTVPKEEKSLLPKSARGNSMTPRSNSVNSKPVSVSITANDESVQNSPPKKTTTKKLVESLVRKRSGSNNNANAATTSTSTNSKGPYLVISPANSPRSSIASEGSSFSPLLGTSPSSSSMGMPSPNFNQQSSGNNSANMQSSSGSSVVRAMQESTFTLDSFEKKKLQKFTILDTPGVISQRDLVSMTLNASTRPTATFSLKSVVFMCSLADFDLTTIDGKDDKIKRLHDSLAFFEKTLVMSNNLKEMRRILVFTHVDVFEHRILNELTSPKKKQLLELLGIAVNEDDLENCELVHLTFKHIVSLFETLEKKNPHKYILEYYALNMMDTRDVCEFTYHLTMRDGYTKKDYPSMTSINVYSSPIVSGCEYEVIQNIQMVNSFYDISLMFQ